jgi:hypothetical protein
MVETREDRNKNLGENLNIKALKEKSTSNRIKQYGHFKTE